MSLMADRPARQVRQIESVPFPLFASLAASRLPLARQRNCVEMNSRPAREYARPTDFPFTQTGWKRCPASLSGHHVLAQGRNGFFERRQG
jgi:hypothetical protein